MAGIKAERERIVARNDEDRTAFLRKRGFSLAQTERVIATVEAVSKFGRELLIWNEPPV